MSNAQLQLSPAFLGLPLARSGEPQQRVNTIMEGSNEEYSFNLRGRMVPRHDPFPGQRPVTRESSAFTAPLTRVRFEETESRSRSLSPTRRKLQFEAGIEDESIPSFLQTGTPICGEAESDPQNWMDPDPCRARAANMLAPPSAPEQSASDISNWPPPPPGYLTSLAGSDAAVGPRAECKQEPITPAEQRPYAALWAALQNMNESLKRLTPPVPQPKPVIGQPRFEGRSRSATRVGEAGNLPPKLPPPLVPARSSSTTSDATQRPPTQTAVSDTIMAPECFLGQKGDDGEFFVDSFEDYSSYKRLQGDDKRRVFGRFLKGQAREWYQTLGPDQLASYDSLLNAFKERYFRAPEVKFVEAASLWSEPQKLTETVMDFVTRLKKIAMRLNISDEMLHHALIHGLKPSIKASVLTKGVTTLDQTVKAAKIAETALGVDPLQNMLIEALTRNASLADKQTAQITDLTARVAALTTGAPAPLQQQLPLPQQAYYYEPMMYGQPPGPTILSVDNDDQTPDGPPVTTGQRNSVGNGSGQTYQQRQQGGYRPRQSRPTPQNIQRANYARQQQRQQPPADRNFNDRRQVRFNEPPPDGGEACRNCLRHHREGEVCYAATEDCRRCGKRGHYARCCRSARRD